MTSGGANLTDRFARRHSYLRISVSDRCNMRCSYCMPHEDMPFMPAEALLTFDEILRLARLCVSMGVTKIRLTGGEPLVRPNLDALIRRLSALDGLETLAMTTNASLLKDRASALRQAGIQALNISLDTLDAARFQRLTRRACFADVMAGFEAALDAGFDSLKLNVVVLNGFNDDEILDFVEFTRDKPVNLRFIEAMPFKDNQWEAACLLPYREVKRRIEAHYDLKRLPGDVSAVAKDFGLYAKGGKKYAGTLSFITSMTDSFCGTCNRLRLTADGRVKACLFQPLEVNLRDAMRMGASDADLNALIGQALLSKWEAHEPAEDLARDSALNRPMIAIGG